MHAAFGTVVVVVCVVALVVALAALLLSHRTWEDYGKRGLTFDSEHPDSDHAQDEVRELLEARNARRALRGEPQLDVEQELSRLSRTAAGTTVDPALRAEIRDLVMARSSRLVKAGKPPLDVDREVERELARLSGHGPSTSG